MSFYQNRILPHLQHLIMRNRQLQPYRERVVGAAEGRVLEVGVGSCLNLPFYSPQVREVIGLEPVPRLVAMARNEAADSSLPVTFTEGSAEEIPLDDSSIDTVVITWTLCTIPQVVKAMHEMRRVLRPGGQLLFVEHGRAPEESVRKWQDRLTPTWKSIAGGCHLNRPIRTLIEDNGFAMAQIDTGYMKGPKPMTFLYEGCAKPA
ncbi:class I SAM-dependent methyltransferase [Fodinicurvata halophila]|uniref:Class I SAM-dependent methyltransferase n=1 Tax=Fodinicurvata halophila TaxID=1419723 RepID=A0ABV8UIY8_9PROT